MAKSKKFTTDDAPLVTNPFAQLLGGGAPEDSEELVEPEAPKPQAPKPDPSPKVAKGGQGRVVVRREKKGRGGKTVTMVDGLSESQGREWLPRIKRELGCGGKQEGRLLVIGTSDHVRVQRWLDDAGVARTVLGN